MGEGQRRNTTAYKEGRVAGLKEALEIMHSNQNEQDYEDRFACAASALITRISELESRRNSDTNTS